jgi:hypothetical protein
MLEVWNYYLSPLCSSNSAFVMREISPWLLHLLVILPRFFISIRYEVLSGILIARIMHCKVLWKQAVVANFKMPSHKFLEGPKDTAKHLGQNGQSPV